jgi:hypothetical protein
MASVHELILVIAAFMLMPPAMLAEHAVASLGLTVPCEHALLSPTGHTLPCQSTDETMTESCADRATQVVALVTVNEEARVELSGSWRAVCIGLRCRCQWRF